MIRAAVIGLGDISGAHIGGIGSAEDARLTAACDIDASRRAALPADVSFYTDYKEMLQKEELDVVHLCLPHYLHYPVARDVATAGRHIFAEKPMAMDGAECDRYIALEKEYGIKICICLQNRYNATSEKLRALLEGGEYGAVTGVRGAVSWYRSKEYYESKPWRGLLAQAGGGCMMNQSIHTLDLLQYFAGSPVERIKGNIGQVLDYGVEVEDTATARLYFENGAVGLFAATIANYEDRNVEVEVRCEKATFLIRDKALFCLRDGKREELAADGTAFVGKQVYGNSHARLIDKFYRALKSGGEDYVSPAEGAASVRLIEAIRRSSEIGETIRLAAEA